MWSTTMDLSSNEIAFVICAFVFQFILIIHFGFRKWRFELALRYGWIVYVLSIPAAVVSLFLILDGELWFLWLAGLMYLLWAVYGFTVEYLKQIEWRSPIRWPVFLPYVSLYLATIMLYWWPLGALWRPLWYAQGLLFVVSTVLNVTSHNAVHSQQAKRPG